MAKALTILEAAQQLGVSPDTIRRHVKSGDLPAHQEKRGRGYQWLIEPIPENGHSKRQNGEAAEGSHSEMELLEALVADLRGTLQAARVELDARRREMDRLLTLLERTQTP